MEAECSLPHSQDPACNAYTRFLIHLRERHRRGEGNVRQIHAWDKCSVVDRWQGLVGIRKGEKSSDVTWILIPVLLRLLVQTLLPVFQGLEWQVLSSYRVHTKFTFIFDIILLFHHKFAMCSTYTLYNICQTLCKKRLSWSCVQEPCH